MFSHVCMGADDVAAAKRFYDAALGALGYAEGAEIPGAGRVIYSDGTTALMITVPINGEPATHANGGTVGFIASSKAAVDVFHAAGIAAGGTDEGMPGERPAIPGSYAAYLRDPAGNKIVAWCRP